jgi:hypothetical protein
LKASCFYSLSATYRSISISALAMWAGWVCIALLHVYESAGNEGYKLPTAFAVSTPAATTPQLHWTHHQRLPLLHSTNVFAHLHGQLRTKPPRVFQRGRGPKARYTTRNCTFLQSIEHRPQGRFIGDLSDVAHIRCWKQKHLLANTKAYGEGAERGVLPNDMCSRSISKLLNGSR